MRQRAMMPPAFDDADGISLHVFACVLCALSGFILGLCTRLFW
jgi:hypothetical protein